MGHSVTHSGIKEGKVQLTYIFRCILKEHSSAGWWADWCGKRIRASESERPNFKSHPWNLLLSWFGVNRSPLGVLPLSLPPTWVEVFWVLPMTGGCNWQLVGGATDAKCPAKDRRAQFNKELFHPRCQQCPHLRTLSSSVCSTVRIVISIPTFQAESDV